MEFAIYGSCEQLARTLGLEPDVVQRGIKLMVERNALGDPAVEGAIDAFLLTRNLTIFRELLIWITGSES